MEKLKIDTNSLLKYEFCPSKYFLDTLKGVSLEEQVFTLKCNLFKIFFKDPERSEINLLSFFNEHKDLFEELYKGTAIDLISVHTYKCLDMLLGVMGNTSQPKLGTQHRYRIGDSCEVTLDIAATNITKSKGIATFSFYILVPANAMDIIDLSNRFENILIAKYLWPSYRLPCATFDIVYFSPCNGTYKTIKEEQLNTIVLDDVDVRRMQNIIENIGMSNFIRNPSASKCRSCDQFSGCNPTLFNFAEPTDSGYSAKFLL